jgi:lipopolysaccharide export system permease protein
VLTIFIIGVFLILIINPINTIALKLYNSELSLVNKYTSNFSINDTGVWLREGSSSGQRVVHAQNVVDQGEKLKDVSIFEFNKFSIPIARISSKLVFISDNGWDLKDGKIWKVNRIERPEDRAKSFESMWLDTELSLDKIKLGYGEPSKISFWELNSYIKRIERAGFSSLKHRLHLHKEIVLPLLMVGMFLIGGALNMGHSRLSKKRFTLLITILMGISGFLLNNLTKILGENEAIHYLFAAWAPPVIIIFIVTGLILHLEDG